MRAVGNAAHFQNLNRRRKRARDRKPIAEPNAHGIDLTNQRGARHGQRHPAVMSQRNTLVQKYLAHNRHKHRVQAGQKAALGDRGVVQAIGLQQQCHTQAETRKDAQAPIAHPEFGTQARKGRDQSRPQ